MNFIKLFILIMTSVVYANDLDCNNINSNLEKIICSNYYLKEEDNKLTFLYNKIKREKTNEEFEAIEKEHQKWINELNKCKSAFCIQNAYFNRIYILEKIYPLEDYLVKKDYNKIFEIISGERNENFLKSSTHLEYYFNKIFPNDLIKELEQGKHFKVEYQSNYKYPYYQLRKLSLNNYNYMIEGDDGMFGMKLLKTDFTIHFDEPNKKLSKLEKIIMNNKKLIELENKINKISNEVYKASYTKKEYENLITNYENKINDCLKSKYIEECLVNTYSLSIEEMKTLINERKKIIYTNDYQSILNKIPSKFFIEKREHFSSIGPGTYDKIAIDIKDNNIKYWGTILPDFQEYSCGNNDPVVQTIDETIHIFKLSKIINDIDGQVYNSIIIKTKELNEDKFYLANTLNTPPCSYDYENKKEHIFIGEVAMIEN